MGVAKLVELKDDKPLNGYSPVRSFNGLQTFRDLQFHVKLVDISSQGDIGFKVTGPLTLHEDSVDEICRRAPESAVAFKLGVPQVADEFRYKEGIVPDHWRETVYYWPVQYYEAAAKSE